MLIYHGAFARRGYYHESAAIETRCATEAVAPVPSSPAESAASATEVTTASSAPECSSMAADDAGASSAACSVGGHRLHPPAHFAWADLLRRIFLFDILACDHCGGRLRLVATIEDLPVVTRILQHLGLPCDPLSPVPARSPPWLPGLRDQRRIGRLSITTGLGIVE